MAHYSGLYDIQTLAMLSCVFAGSKRRGTLTSKLDSTSSPRADRRQNPTNANVDLTPTNVRRSSAAFVHIFVFVFLPLLRRLCLSVCPFVHMIKSYEWILIKYFWRRCSWPKQKVIRFLWWSVLGDGNGLGLQEGLPQRVYIVCPLSVLLPVLANKDVHILKVYSWKPAYAGVAVGGTIG